MIPKLIHYCWFGRNPLPTLAIKCIESWRKYLPDYEIREWNEDNFDVNIISYTQEAYQAKKYAFVSDYARFWILYKYGGIYFDTDVEVIKPLDDIIARGSFMGCQMDEYTNSKQPCVAPGLGLASMPNHYLYAELLHLYENLHFVDRNGNLNLKTVVHYTTEVLCEHGLKEGGNIQCIDGIWIYPKEYFCPLDVLLQMNMTENTRTIHHFSATWLPKHKQLVKKIKRMVGYALWTKLNKYIFRRS